MRKFLQAWAVVSVAAVAFLFDGRVDFFARHDRLFIANWTWQFLWLACGTYWVLRRFLSRFAVSSRETPSVWRQVFEVSSRETPSVWRHVFEVSSRETPSVWRHVFVSSRSTPRAPAPGTAADAAPPRRAAHRRLRPRRRRARGRSEGRTCGAAS